MSNKIKIIKDQAGTTAKVEGIDVKSIPLNSYTCGITASTGGITIFNPNSPNEFGNPTKIFHNVPYTSFVKSDGTDPISAEDLKSDIDLQLTQSATSEDSGYRGLWNASTNTPDLSNLNPSPEVGDFLFVSESGNYNGVDYEINDRVQYNGVSFDRIPAPDPWEYIQVDNSYDITVLNNRTFVDYTLTSNKSLTLPSLSPSDAGWMCSIVNSSTYRLMVMGTTSGARQLRKGGSIQLLFNGVGFVVLGYARSGSILSITDFQSSAVSHNHTIYVDGNSTVEPEDVDGSVLFPYNNIQEAIDNSNDGDTIDLRGTFEITTPIIIDYLKDTIFTSKEGQTTIKYASFNESNSHVFYQPNTSCTKQYSFINLDINNAGGYGIYFKSASKVVVEDCKFVNNGWNGQGLNTILDSSTSGVLGYDSSNTELQAFYSGANASNGGAMRLENIIQVEVISNEVTKNLRGIRLQDCGIGGYGFITRNVSTQNIESGIYLATGSSGGCQNMVVAINSSSYNANNGLLCIGGINNKFSQNEVNGNWNAGLCGWGSANLTLRDCGLYDNNRSQYNGIGSVGDAKASIQINDAYSFLATTFSLNPNARFLAEILDTQVHYTGLGSNSSRVGFLLSEGMGDIPDNDRNIIKIDDVGFIGQDYAIDLSEVDTTNLRVSLGDNSYQSIGEKAVREPLEGYYYELPFSNHLMKLNEVDISVTNTGNIIIKEGAGGSVTNPYSINDLQALAHGSEIKVILKGSKKIQFVSPVSGCSINGSMVNSVLSLALVQLNDLFTNTSGFTNTGNPVTAFNLINNDLTITLQDNTSFTVDVTTLGVDENKFVLSGQLNGSNLELTMNDNSVITIDASNMINGSSLPAIANNWYIAYGSVSGTEVTTHTFTNSIKNILPIYNGTPLKKGSEFMWSHDDSGTLSIGTWQGATNVASGTSTSVDSNWGIKLKIEGDSTGGGRNIVCPVNDSSVTTHSVGVDIDSRFSTGYSIDAGTVFSLRYEEDNYLYFYDISDGDYTLICKSTLVLDGNPIFLHASGQAVAVQTRIPSLVERFSDWTIVHDFDNSEVSISDGVEEDTILKSNISISSGEKMLLNFNYFGRNESVGLGYSGSSSGVNNAPINIDSRLFYNSAELLRAVSGDASGSIWNWNTSASKYYDPNGDGSNVGYLNGSGLNLGLISFRYQLNNVMELWHETNNERIATLAVPLDGLDVNVYVGFSEAHPSERIPSISKQTIGQGPQPISSFAPDISNQSFDITEGTSFNVQIALDANSDIVNQYVEEDAPSWVVLNQDTGVFNGTAPAYNGSTDSYVINCKAANAVGGSTTFQVTLNVQEITYTNTKSLFFEDGVSSYLGGNAALVTSLERSANGSGSSDAWSFSLWIKGSTANSGQTLFYFGNNDVVNNGHIELRQTNHNGLKRLRLRYGTNGNHLQFTTPSGSINPSSWQHVLVTYDGGETGVASGSMSTYYGAFKIYIDGVLQTTSNTHSNFGYSGSVVGQNFRFGRFASGTYPKDITYNQMAIWDNDQSSNISDIYNGGVTQDLSLLNEPPVHYYEIESSVSTIQDLTGNAHLVGYNFTSSDLVDDAPTSS